MLMITTIILFSMGLFSIINIILLIITALKLKRTFKGSYEYWNLSETRDKYSLFFGKLLITLLIINSLLILITELYTIMI